MKRSVSSVGCSCAASVKREMKTGAAISHHHGVGMAREPYIRDDLASSAVVLGKIKAAIDPAGVMNPGKLSLNQNNDG